MKMILLIDEIEFNLNILLFNEDFDKLFYYYFYYI